jgi:LssY-like putative type I secretion system component LssY
MRRAQVLGLVAGWMVVTTATAASREQASQAPLEIRLQTYLTSYASAPGSEFRAVVVAPYESNGRVLIPRGSIVSGSVRHVKSVGLGLVHERASLDLSFHDYETPDGQKFPLDAKLVSIDNAREKVTPQGKIKGVLAARTPNGLINGFWNKPTPNLFYRSLIGLTGTSNQIWERFALGPTGAAALFAIHCTLFPFPEPEIRLPPGTDLFLDVKISPEDTASYPAPAHIETSASFAAWLQSQPRELRTASQKLAADIINVAFVGTQEELTDAFAAAGWSPAEPASIRSFSRVYGAFNSMRDYATAPVSRLLYQGVLPDLVFQKSLNTVSKRHHVRIWKAQTFEGQDVWLGAATHDTGIAFRPTAFAFSHKIDMAIDTERSKIVNDFVFSECALSVSYVRPPEDTAETTLPTDIVTDKRIAVLSLQSCSATPAVQENTGPKPPGSKFTRLARRWILETRYYLVRENPYYWTYEIVQWRRNASSRAACATDACNQEADARRIPTAGSSADRVPSLPERATNAFSEKALLK